MARARSKKAVTSKAKRKAPLPQAESPTPEMQARVKFELGQVINETGQRIGLAYRRTPLLETMARSGSFSPDELAAMRFYRTTFDRMERSAVRSCLNVTNGTGGESSASIMHITPSMLDAKRKAELCEQSLDFTLHTMRGVLLYDQSFRELAMLRYGSRVIMNGKGTPIVSPKSGRHTGYIKDEFLRGLKILTDEIRSMVTKGPIEEVWVNPQPDGTATIQRGLCAPAGRYRCLGDNVLVDQVMATLRTKFGRKLEFMCAEQAIDALKNIEIERFKHLQEEDLAA